MVNWYTKETFVYGNKLSKVSNDPGTHYVDEAGNKVVGDGNHRAYRDLTQGREPNSRQIGKLRGDTSKDPWCRRVEDLKVSDADPPFDD